MGQQNWGTDHLPLVSNILMFNPQDSLGSTLRNLSTLQLLFCLILALVFVYTVFLATVILARLRSLRTVQNDNSSRKSLSLLNHRSANLRQMIVAVFYLFGLMSFLQLQIAFWTPESGRPAAIIGILQRVFPFFCRRISCLSLNSLSSMVRILSNSHSRTPTGCAGFPVGSWTKEVVLRLKRVHCPDSLFLD